MVTLLAALALCQTQAQAPQGPAFASKLRTLVVFKEGFGFYVREGTALLENGWATTNLVPMAVGGTLWVSPKNAADRVDTIILTKDNRIGFEKPEELKTQLANKVGLRLRITTKTGAVEGKLTNLLDKMMLVQDAKQDYVAIEYGAIRGVSLIDFPVKIKLRTKNPNGKSDIGLAYVQEGVRWSPSYLLEMDGKQGRLTLRGTLLDLPEELDDANVVFVVGAPSLSNRGSIDELLQGFMSGIYSGVADFVSFDSSDNSVVAGAELKARNAPAASGGGRGGFGGGAFEGAPVTTDETGELQYYTKPNFSLRPGERAMATIFEIEIPVTPLFDWDADGKDVQYILTLENKSTQPFTTGPVFVVEGQRPVGQQRIEYTAPGGKTELRLATGIGLKTERTETELKRADPIKVGEQNYLPITLQGKLTLENFRKEAADVRIHRTLVGKTLDLGGGKVKNVDVAATGPSTTSRVEWSVSVPAGKKVEIVYTYETYSVLGR